MLYNIKNRINKELSEFIDQADKVHSLSKISPLLFNCIKNYCLRDGKRVRPMLFVIGYLGFSDKIAANLYKSALSLELLHDFMLIHDDIIDKSDLRRGKPSMHKMLNSYLKNKNNIKFNGQDLSIVVGDVLYAIAIDAFLSIKENSRRKERALRNFIQAAIYTGSGEFIELLSGVSKIEDITKEDIYKIYDYKTAHYTFSSPLSTGAILAGASNTEINKLLKYGICLGRAFQIKDDILGMFSEENKTGKSSLTDLEEAKKTVLIWFAYNNTNARNRSAIKDILKKKKVGKEDLLTMRKIIIDSGALNYAKNEILNLKGKANLLLKSSKISQKYKNFLDNFSQQLFKL